MSEIHGAVIHLVEHRNSPPSGRTKLVAKKFGLQCRTAERDLSRVCGGGEVETAISALGLYRTEAGGASVGTNARSLGTDVSVRYADFLHEVFPDLNPVVDDLFLLEAHQIAGLPERAPAPELAAVLHAYPRLQRFFVARRPQIERFLTRLLAEHSAVRAGDLAVCEQVLLWEIADWIAYQRAPESYHSGAKVDWDVAAVTEVVTLDGKVVIDAGAGTGRVAFDAAPAARHVFAVEPVATLRLYLRDKAGRLGIDNLYVLDGFLHAIPLPAGSADVLLTCQAIGWNLPEELPEIERVVKPGGTAMHLFGTSSAAQPGNPLYQQLMERGYQPETYQKGNIHIRRYWKQIGA